MIVKNTGYTHDQIINKGMMRESARFFDPPVNNKDLDAAAALFGRKKYEEAVFVYLNMAFENLKKYSGENVKPVPKLHTLYSQDELPNILSSYYNTYHLSAAGEYIEKGFMTFGLSQCVNNIIANTFNANDYSHILVSGKIQKMAIVFMVKAVEMLNGSNLLIDFKCNNSVNYNFALYELNSGIIYQSAPGRKELAEDSLNNALKRIEVLNTLEPCTKHLKMLSLIYGQLGDADKALEYAEKAINQTSEVDLSNITTMKYIASMDASGGKIPIQLY